MGSPISIPSRNERCQRNRLSKAPGNSLRLKSISPQYIESDGSISVPSSPTVSIPDDTSYLTCNCQKARTFSHLPLEPEALHAAFDGRGEEAHHIPRSCSETSLFSFRRASFRRPMITRRPSQLPWLPERSSRTYSLHSTPQYTTCDGDNTTGGSPCFSSLIDSSSTPLIRRKSLLTQPGVATRRPRKTRGRIPFATDQEVDSICDFSSRLDQSSRRWRPSTCDDVDLDLPTLDKPVARAETPNGYEYTYLGALKLGSLRVVNGAVSPCPSDRTSMVQPLIATPEPRQDGDNTMQSSGSGDEKCRGPMDKILTAELFRDLDFSSEPSAKVNGYLEPFSFELSPASSPVSLDKTLGTGIAHSSDDGYEKLLDRCTYDNLARLGEILSKDNEGNIWGRSLSFTDSGYASECSLRSIRGSMGLAQEDDTESVCLFTEKF